MPKFEKQTFKTVIRKQTVKKIVDFDSWDTYKFEWQLRECDQDHVDEIVELQDELFKKV